MSSTESHRRPNSEDVAREAGVSRATVSYILNNRPHVSIPVETRERVHAAARKLGYRPNQSARALVTGRTGLVALWLWGERLQGAYQAHFSHHMQSEMEKHPYQLIIHLANYHTVDLSRAKMFAPWQTDGIISHEAGPAIEAQLGPAGYKALPIVSTGGYNWLPGTDRVAIDLSTGAREAVEHLVAGGRKRIAYLTDSLLQRTGDARYQQYIATLQSAGLPTEFIEIDAPTRASARRCVREALQSGSRPEALFCHNDELAIGAYRGIRDLGLRIPDDVALVGCDGLEESEYLDTPLSTIVQPFTEMCVLAWRFLERRMSDPSAPRQEIQLATHLVVRESSRA